MSMKLINPYSFSNDLFRRLDQFLSMPTENDWGDWPFGSLSSGELSTNVWEDEDAFYVEMEVPGIKPEEIDLSLIGTELSVKISRPAPKEEKEVRYLRRERSFGNMVRTITLPMEMSPKEMNATIEEGVLCVRLQKPEVEKIRKITIHPQKS
ncbi:MAG: Hsp20/alpha crystallin family protein [Planctomycetaceae bacterium]|nr:Hsp20/alpha crystallin family protein [Planctomycetaceae bacterium]